MSAIGEHLAFVRQATLIQERLKSGGLSEAEIEKLKSELDWLWREADFCWAAAKYECEDDDNTEDRDD